MLLQRGVESRLPSCSSPVRSVSGLLLPSGLTRDAGLASQGSLEPLCDQAVCFRDFSSLAQWCVGHTMTTFAGLVFAQKCLPDLFLGCANKGYWKLPKFVHCSEP